MVGGLGNQLFILNYALNLGFHRVIFLWHPSTCRLEENAPVLSQLLIPTEKQLEFHKIQSEVQRFILNKSLGLSEVISRNVITRLIFRKLNTVLLGVASTFLPGELKVNKKQFVTQVGYFQDRKYATIEVMQKSLFDRPISDSVSTYKSRAETEMPLIVHVRIGDYLHIPGMDMLNQDYYREAIELIWDPDRFKKIWFFSDSLINIADYLPEGLIDFSKSIDDKGFSTLDLLEVMTFGNGYVISNSTLSWWGAVLSTSGNSHVAAPHPWFRQNPLRESLYFENWLQVERKR